MASDKEADLQESRALVRRAGTFSAGLLSRRQSYCDPSTRLRVHETVLKPLLRAAVECWAYGIRPRSAIYRQSSGILERARGKYRVCLDGDPVRGHEPLWNSTDGERGTIVILVPRKRFDAGAVFSYCREAFVFDNFLSGHTPAAIRFARERVAGGGLIAVCLPRNNGIEWMDIHAPPRAALRLFDRARSTSRA